MNTNRIQKSSLWNNRSCNSVIVSVLSILVLLVTVDIYLSLLRSTPYETSSKLQEYRPTLPGTGIDHAGEDSQGIVFHTLDELEDMSVAGDESWQNLIAGDGYLFVQPRNSSFPREPWGVSMFHGLHCLQMLRSKIQEFEGVLSPAHNQSDRRQDQHSHHHGGLNETAVTSTHYRHCFSYLAQLITCAMDDTLEPPHIHTYKNGTFKEYNIDGYGTWHQCRDQSLTRQKIQESVQTPLERWTYAVGDTVESVWGETSAG